MSYHGKTEIILTNVKTGQAVTIKKDNIVTEAVHNLLNAQVGKNMLMGSNKLSTGINKLTKEVAKNLYGGILIFSEALDENVNKLLPTGAEATTMIGCGNQSTAVVSNSFKGVFNSLESSISDDVVTFVWDFTTSQCNGNIACICLTSDVGGNTGYRFDAVAETNKWSFLPFALDTSSISSVYATNDNENNPYKNIKTNGNSYPVGYDVASNKFLCMDYNSCKVYTLSDYKRLVKFLSSTPYTSTSEVHSGTYQGVKASDRGYLTDCFESDGVYFFMDEYNIETPNVTFYKTSNGSDITPITVPTFNYAQQIKEDCAFSYRYAPIAPLVSCWNNNHFISVKYKLIPGNTSDSIITLYTCSADGATNKYSFHPSAEVLAMLLDGSSSTKDNYYYTANNTKYQLINDDLYVAINNVDNKWFYIDVENCKIEEYPTFYAPNTGRVIFKDDECSAKPWRACIRSGFGGASADASAVKASWLQTAYLATINNQETVLTKTSEHTMKIKYTLTYVPDEEEV